MYKLKLKNGEKVTVKDLKRSGLTGVFIGGQDYPQSTLQALFEAGFKTLVSKSKETKE